MGFRRWFMSFRDSCRKIVRHSFREITDPTEFNPDWSFNDATKWLFQQQWIHDGAIHPDGDGSAGGKSTRTIEEWGLVPGTEYTIRVSMSAYSDGGGALPNVYLSHGTQIVWEADKEGVGYTTVTFTAESTLHPGVTVIARNAGTATIESVSVMET